MATARTSNSPPARARKAAAKKIAKTTAKKAAKKITKKAAAKKVAKKTTKKAAPTKATPTKATPKKAAKKQTAGKQTAKKTPAKATRYPFPFLGAGLASYFEWGGLYVWFVDPPPKSARPNLLKKIPEPFRHDAEWGGHVLHATSGDQFINLHICTAYARLGDPDDRGDPDDEDYMDGLEFGVGQPFPNSAQMKAFEADLVTWLHALHRHHPIAFVARREDSEAGGTKLDAWHRWSLTRFADVCLPRIQAHLREPGHKLENWAVHELLNLALDASIKDQVPAAIKTWYEEDR